MDQNLIESYKEKMLSMYRKNVKSTVALSENVTENEIPKSAPTVVENKDEQSDSGKLQAIVTTVRSLLFLPNARVTVFTGEIDDMQVIDSDVTDQNGRTKEFVLKTPSKSLSLDSENSVKPYALYNILVEADGYQSNIHLNIPIFSSVTSQQLSDMMLLETTGAYKGPQIFDEQQNYTL